MRKRILICLVSLAAFLAMFSQPAVSNAESTPVETGVDFMIVCAHPGDEYLFLGGALPLYAGEQGRSAVVVYLSSSDDAQRQAAVDALARFGDNVQAVFGPFSPVYTSTDEEALRYWDSREVTTFLVGAIREYRPAIVITHHPLGEYGHGAHCVASDCTVQAVRFSGEANRYPESSALYGAWQVNRLFLHQYGDTPVTLDRSRPLAHFDGLTALELDQQGYAYYPETYPIKICDESGYTNAQYGLAFAADETAFDPASGDLFDGMDAALLGPTATPIPPPSPTPAPTVEPAPTATQSAVSGATLEAGNLVPPATLGLNGVMMIVSGALAAAALAAFFLLKTHPSLKRAAIILCAVSVAVFLFFGLRGARLAQAHISASAVSATPAFTTTPAPTASTVPTAPPEPTPTPDPWDVYFRSDSDPAEVVVSDPEHEHWEYRSDTLSVIINRIHVTRADGKPICYCIAQIHMRGEDAFQAGVRNDNPLAAPGLEHAWHMARRYRAVLGITGDNLIQAEVSLKGILMRNGKIYSRNQAQDILAFYPNDLTMKIYKPKSISIEELQEQGVVNTFSFGPTMLNNGVRDLTARRSSLGRTNPRSGIGMVEPGYFIAITVDGRQKDYSVGMSIQEFTQLFYLNGCQVAYNLDGGASVAMIFMGECLNQHSGIDSDVQRPWTDGLLWGHSELVPTVDDPVYNDGSKPWVMPPT
ncbi:MAG: hypothetical protein GX417_09810 [Clostridiales bacterium]|nr:hypothetical protein [Clostridiales bacterium]